MILNLLRNLALLGLLGVTCYSFESQVGKCIGEAKFPDDPLVRGISETWGVGLKETEELVSLAFKYAPTHGFPTPLDVLAVIAVESSFQRASIHKAGPSVGPMQINTGVHGSAAGNSVSTNIRTGVKILEEYREKANSDEQALTSYNAGPSKGHHLCKGSSCNSPYVRKIKKAKERILRYERS